MEWYEIIALLVGGATGGALLKYFQEWVTYRLKIAAQNRKGRKEESEEGRLDKELDFDLSKKDRNLEADLAERQHNLEKKGWESIIEQQRIFAETLLAEVGRVKDKADLLLKSLIEAREENARNKATVEHLQNQISRMDAHQKQAEQRCEQEIQSLRGQIEELRGKLNDDRG